MPEPPESSLSRRGAWIGLRTLRQRPKVVDHTPSGEPIFEVRSVRLLLQPEADHFNRLETCSKCGRNVPGGPVFDLADLDRPSNPLICTTCVQAVAKPTLLRSGPRRPATPERAAPAPAASSGPEADSRNGAEPTPDGEARPVEGGHAEDDIRQNLQRVTQLIEAQQRQLGTLAEAVREAREEARSASGTSGALAQSQRELDERMTAMVERSQQAIGGGADSAVERDLRHNLQFVTELLQAQQRELSALGAALVETRNDLQAVTQSHQAMARSHMDLDQRLRDLAPADPLNEEHSRRTASLERGLEDISARLDEGLAQTRSGTADLVGELRAEVRALAQSVEAQRHHFESAEDAGARAELSTLAQAVGDLRAASSETDSRLQALHRDLIDIDARLSSLIAAEPTHSSARNREAALPGRSPGGDLLDALDRQLKAAEGRLARRSGASGQAPPGR